MTSAKTVVFGGMILAIIAFADTARADDLKVRQPHPSEIGMTATCPVMHETFKVDEHTVVIDYNGKSYYFCCPDCVDDFKSDPDKFAAGSVARIAHVHGDHAHQGADKFHNPGFGDQIYYTHPKGTWMVNYQFMHMDLNGLRAGTSNVALQDVGVGKPHNYMLIPTGMTMDMHMVMIMYGVSNRFTAMTMMNYVGNSMTMLMDMGDGPKPMQAMQTSRLGDTQVRGIYKVGERFTASLGASLPTGEIRNSFVAMGMTYRSPYDMQIGSGTYDVKPAFTYTAVSADAAWNWGAQAEYTWRTARSAAGWSLGNNAKVTSWLQRAVGPATTWLRLSYSDIGKISGEDPAIRELYNPATGMGIPAPDAQPSNYGGRLLNALIGVSYRRGQISIGVEGSVPVYQNLNGIQLMNKWALNAGLQVMF